MFPSITNKNNNRALGIVPGPPSRPLAKKGRRGIRNTRINDGIPKKSSGYSDTQGSKARASFLGRIGTTNKGSGGEIEQPQAVPVTISAGLNIEALARIQIASEASEEQSKKTIIPADTKMTINYFEKEVAMNFTISLDDIIGSLLSNKFSAEQYPKIHKAALELRDLNNLPPIERPRPSAYSAALKDPFERHFRGDEVVESEFEYTWNMICTTSFIATSPKEIKALFEDIIKKKLNGQQQFIIVVENTQNIFVLRNILARFSFQTVLQRGIYDTIKSFNASQAAKLNWREAFALVGFNRLFSPQNSMGISLSSDMDYKLVFNPKAIEGDLQLTDEQVAEVVLDLQQMQYAIKPKFDDEAGLVLEVEGFTTRNIVEIEQDLENEDAEKNFLASIFHNNVHIAGSEKVYEDFKGILTKYKKDNEETFIIAERTFTQYLGETDKGSISVIKEVERLKPAVDACAKKLELLLNNESTMVIINKKLEYKEKKIEKGHEIEVEKKYKKGARIKFQEWFKGKTGQKWHELKDKKDLVEKNFTPEEWVRVQTIVTEKEQWLQSPLLFYEMLSLKVVISSTTNTSMKDYLVTENREAAKALDNLPIFKGIEKRAERLGRAAKVLGTLVDQDYFFMYGSKNYSNTRTNTNTKKREKSPTPIYTKMQYQPGFAASCLQQIGSKKLGSPFPSGWRFSLKYAGCRLNDFFDSVPNTDEYLKWCKSVYKYGDVRQIQVYNFVKTIALAVNKFSLSVQNCIYMLAISPKSITATGEEPVLDGRQELMTDYFKKLDAFKIEGDKPTKSELLLYNNMLREFIGEHDQLFKKSKVEFVKLESSFTMPATRLKRSSPPATLTSPPATHTQIDSLYSRITREQYYEMISRSATINDQLETASKTIDDLVQNFKKIKGKEEEVKTELATPFEKAGNENDSEFVKWMRGNENVQVPEWKVLLFEARSRAMTTIGNQWSDAIKIGKLENHIKEQMQKQKNKQNQREEQKPEDPVDISSAIESLIKDLEPITKVNLPKERNSNKYWEPRNKMQNEVIALIKKITNETQPKTAIRIKKNEARRLTKELKTQPNVAIQNTALFLSEYEKDPDKMLREFWENLFDLALVTSKLLDPRIPQMSATKKK